MHRVTRLGAFSIKSPKGGVFIQRSRSRLLTPIIILILTLGIIFLWSQNNDPIREALTPSRIQEAYRLLDESLGIPRLVYHDYRASYENVNTPEFETTLALNNPDSTAAVNYANPVRTLTKNQSSVYTLNIPVEGLYAFAIDYRVPTSTLNNYTLALAVDGAYFFEEAELIDLPIHWRDVTKTYETDRYGDEVIPLQRYEDGWQRVALYDNKYTTDRPLEFYLTAGEHTITVENRSANALVVGSLDVVALPALPTYTTYKATFSEPLASDPLTVEATDYDQKNSSYIHSLALMTPTVEPFDPVYKKLNVIDGTSWDTSGQTIHYSIDVPVTGAYHLALHYMNDKSDLAVFRTIEIDGLVPFVELKSYAFAPVGNNQWANEILGSQGTPFEFYLTEGVHTLTLRAEQAPFNTALRYLQLLSDHINQFSLEVKKITGKEVDENRSWDITKYIPETPDYLAAYSVLLQAAIEEVADFSPKGSNSSQLTPLQKALYKLDKMIETPEKLPLYLDELSGASASVALYVATVYESLQEQPLYLDSIDLTHDAALVRANAGFFEVTYANLASFFSTFTSDKYRIKTEGPEVVEVWVNRPTTYVDIMQKMVDTTFTKETGIQVKISVMPDANKLIMAAAANQVPDVALGLISYMPFDLAVRGAAYDLTQFSDFWQVANRFTPGAFIPYILNEQVYALPETLDFNVLIYRTDIFDQLQLSVPNTWYDVIDLLSELQRYGMNFYHPIAGGGTLKWFYQTSSFVYQFGGDLYHPNGSTTAIDEKAAVDGLNFLAKLFTNYSLPEQVVSFYNQFRYGTLPIGIADFSTYLLIKNAAPEIVGKWEIAPYPGIMREGEIHRDYISNGAAASILQGTDSPEDSWEFLKWWTSAEVQTQFAFTLQSTYGANYVWLSSNLDAVQQSTFNDAHKAVILEQVQSLRDVPRTPGQYILERSISDIWNTAVFDGTAVGVAIDKYTIIINREIQRKMVEFGYLDVDGNVAKPYVIRDVEWVKEQMAFAGEETT